MRIINYYTGVSFVANEETNKTELSYKLDRKDIDTEEILINNESYVKEFEGVGLDLFSTIASITPEGQSIYVNGLPAGVGSLVEAETATTEAEAEAEAETTEAEAETEAE